MLFFKTDLFTKINLGNTILFISVFFYYYYFFQKATFRTNLTQNVSFEMIHFSVFPDKKSLFVAILLGAINQWIVIN